MTDKASVFDGATAEHWQTVEANLGLVWQYIHRRRIPSSARDDAFQDGLFGLLRAAMLFDPEHGTKFSTYAVPWIAQQVERGRGNAEGKNYRRARYYERTDYQPPLSLNVEVRGAAGLGEAIELLDALEARDEQDPADDATWRAAMDVLAEHCVDQLDRDLLAAMRAGTLERTSAKRLALRHSVSTMTVGNRRRRLVHLARRQIDAAA